MSVLQTSIRELQERIHKKELKVSELVDESLAKIREVDGDMKAFITVDEENARKKAKQLDELVQQGGITGPLFGLPAGISDHIATKGLKTTCGSKMLENFEPVYDAAVIEKLNAERAITIGKLNLDEFGLGNVTQFSSFYPTRNPHNSDYISGGAAASVASGEVVFALSSDSGGAIRQQASYAGVVGLKPTYGRVSRYGVASTASSLDAVGPVTRTVEDNAYVLKAIAGFDNRDSTSIDVKADDYVSALTGDVQGIKVAVPKEFLDESVDEIVRNKILLALKELENLGAAWEEVSLPHVKYATAAYQIIFAGESSTSLARFDGIRYGMRVQNATGIDDLYKETRGQGFGEEAKRYSMFGMLVLSSGYYEKYYQKAQKVRALIKRDFDEIFAKYDCIIGPTTPTTAKKVEETIDIEHNRFTIPANLTGNPAISLPCGFDENNLPVGLQIIGKHFAESTLYQVAHALEQRGMKNGV